MIAFRVYMILSSVVVCIAFLLPVAHATDACDLAKVDFHAQQNDVIYSNISALEDCIKQLKNNIKYDLVLLSVGSGYSNRMKAAILTIADVLGSPVNSFVPESAPQKYQLGTDNPINIKLIDAILSSDIKSEAKCVYNSDHSAAFLTVPGIRLSLHGISRNNLNKLKEVLEPFRKTFSQGSSEEFYIFE